MCALIGHLPEYVYLALYVKYHRHSIPLSHVIFFGRNKEIKFNYFLLDRYVYLWFKIIAFKATSILMQIISIINSVVYNKKYCYLKKRSCINKYVKDINLQEHLLVFKRNVNQCS